MNPLLLSIFILCLITNSIYSQPLIDYGNNQGIKTTRSLGISNTFGRWPTGVVSIAYNPEGEPETCTTEIVTSRLQEAFSVWENVAGIDFVYQGLVTNNIDDKLDNQVVMGWTYSEDSWAGSAIPHQGSSNANEIFSLGYSPYTDGIVRLNSRLCPSVKTIAHELGHLIGFGHSDNPESFMYANPYGLKENLTADDIKGAQRLYGVPDRYQAPSKFQTPAAYDGVIISDTKVFITNTNDAAWPNLGNIDEINEETSDNLDIVVSANYSNGPKGKKKTYLTVDPSGDIVSSVESKYELCCTEGTLTIYFGNSGFLKNKPGIWKKFVLIDGLVLYSAELNVNVSMDRNLLPEGSLAINRIDNYTFDIQLSTNDQEGDSISSVWHIPFSGKKDNTNEQVISFENPGIYDLFIEVNDNFQRYDNSGTGHQTLLHEYLVVPANEQIPTYFDQKKIVYLPSFEYHGQYYSAILKETNSDALVLKLLSAKQLNSSFSNLYFDADNRLFLPKVEIVSANGVSSIGTVWLEIIPNSNPIKLNLITDF